MKNINKNLIELNEKMMILMNSSASNYQQDALKTQKQKDVLKNNYNNLSVERDEINKMIYQYETIDSQLNDSELKLTEYYSRYIVLLFITIILFILFFNYFIPNIFSNNLNGGSNKINSFIDKLIR